MPENPAAARGVKTSEFWFMVLYVAVVAGSGYMRVRYGNGLNEIELSMITAAIGGHWYGRTSLKKAIAKNGATLELTEPAK